MTAGMLTADYMTRVGEMTHAELRDELQRVAQRLALCGCV
jgi:hypothetical protein